ncbi:unnamed protein product [Linum tenue]|uniref:glucan endo-1,3-beta-D-glucosidase n=1 Tax=Linum tenue TaxID=586396 RepID=A0AAV0L736_9ROSI|nr:unnamed protein product [Linum tenue]
MKHFFFLVFSPCMHADAQGIGVTLARDMQKPPPPKAILWLLRQKNIKKVRVYDAFNDRDLLEALQDTGIDVLVGMNNDDVYRVAADVSSNEAAKWLEQNIKPYYERVSFRCLQIGRRMSQQGNRQISAVFQALVHVQAAQKRLGLDISLGIDLDTNVMTESFPPSAASFDVSILPVLRPMLTFMEHNMGTLIVSIYPMIRYVTDLYYEYKGVSIDYALLNGETVVVTDNGLQYTNMMDGLMDAFYTSLKKLGISMRVIVGETGWPSSSEVKYATQKLAGEYIYNLAERLKNNVGTPLKPQWHVETFIHTLYVQDKNNDGMYKWYGMFYPNGSPANPYLSL